MIIDKFIDSYIRAHVSVGVGVSIYLEECAYTNIYIHTYIKVVSSITRIEEYQSLCRCHQNEFN
jgi:hypothetical protein